MKIIVSSCLLGLNCRYCGGGALNAEVLKLNEEHQLIPLCPEQLGGLPVPRLPNEILNGQVINKDGTNETCAFNRGAQEVLSLAKRMGCTCAILKERSPSCGSRTIYDGTFSGTKISGMGVTAKLLHENGIKVVSEENIEDLWRQ